MRKSVRDARIVRRVANLEAAIIVALLVAACVFFLVACTPHVSDVDATSVAPTYYGT